MDLSGTGKDKTFEEKGHIGPLFKEGLDACEAKVREALASMEKVGHHIRQKKLAQPAPLREVQEA